MNIELLLIPLIIFGGIVGYPLLQVWAVVRMKRVWRWLSVLPLLIMVPVLAVTFVGLAQKSNLWPIFLILTAPFALVYLALLLIVHRATQARHDVESGRSSSHPAS